MKLGRDVTVDDGGNYVTERSHKVKKKVITPHNESLGRLCSDVMSSCWDPTWFTITSENTMMLLKMLFIKSKS